MRHTIVIAVNWPKLRDNLTRECGEKITDAQLQTWLKDAGFENIGGRWRSAESALYHLDPSEVISIDDEEHDEIS